MVVPTTHYNNFDLTFIPDGDDYLTKIQCLAGEATGYFSIPFSQSELLDFKRFTAPGRRSVRRINDPEVAMQIEFGGRLFNAIFSGEILGRYYSSLDGAFGKGESLRIRVRLTDAPDLAELPWEYLYNPSRARFLARHQDTPIVRYLEISEPVRRIAVNLPLRVLVVIFNPADSAYARLDVEKEWENLNSALGELEKKGLLSVDLLEDATPAALRERLRENVYHIFHFIGHGGFDEEKHEGILIMKGEYGGSRRVGSQRLGWDLHEHKTLALAVINACEGARPDATDIFSGTAQTLVQQGIPAVVAMQREITDDAAKEFARAFYTALSKGYPLEYAVTMSRQEIGDNHELEWATPVLFMRSPDGYLFDLKEASKVNNKPLDVLPRERVIPIAEADEPARRVDEVLQDSKVTVLQAYSTDATMAGKGVVEQLFDTDAINLQNASRLKVLQLLSAVGVGKKPGIVWWAHFLKDGRLLYVKHAGRGASGDTLQALLSMPKGNVIEGADADYGYIKNLLLSDTFGVPMNWSGRSELGSGYTKVSFRDEGGRAFDWQKDNSEPNFEVRFSRESEQLVLLSVAEGKIIRIWKVPNWTGLAGTSTVNAVSYVFTVPGNVVDVDLSFDGRIVACATGDQFVRLWDTGTGQPLKPLDHGVGDRVDRVVFSPGGKVIATITANGVVRVWTSLEGAEGHALAGNSQKVIRAAFSADGELLATGSLQGVVCLWNVSNGNMLCSVDLRRDRLNMNAYPNSMEFSPDGRVLACGMQDGFIRLLVIPSL